MKSITIMIAMMTALLVAGCSNEDKVKESGLIFALVENDSEYTTQRGCIDSLCRIPVPTQCDNPGKSKKSKKCNLPKNKNR